MLKFLQMAEMGFFEDTSTPTRPVENAVLTTKGLQERNTQLLDETTGEKGRIIN